MGLSNNIKNATAGVATTFTFPVGKAVNFPPRCVNCGVPAEETSRIVVKRLVTIEHRKSRKQLMVDFTQDVPHCPKCARLERGLFWPFFLSTVVPFLAVGIPVFLLVYRQVSHARDDLGLEVGTRQHMWLEEVTAGGAGFVAGLLAVGLMSWLVKALLLPVYGLSVKHRPNVLTSMFTDREHVLGLTAQISEDGNTATITLFNDDITEEFAWLNPDAIPVEVG